MSFRIKPTHDLLRSTVALQEQYDKEQKEQELRRGEERKNGGKEKKGKKKEETKTENVKPAPRTAGMKVSLTSSASIDCM